jgi:hypothetical protein
MINDPAVGADGKRAQAGFFETPSLSPIAEPFAEFDAVEADAC